jgi:probable F420-dependent oxidoreductase
VKPFRFAVQLSKATSAEAWRDLARKTEELGYSTLFMPDHLDDQFAPLVALTVAAEATQTLKVGSLVFDNDFRHPLVLAKELATLDLFSEGRLEVGLGAGWMRTDYDEAGIPYDRPGVRISRLEEALSVMKGLWSAPLADFNGEHYVITSAHGKPEPHNRPHPPILIGGGSPKVLRLAGREADIVGINPNLAAGRIDGSMTTQLSQAHYRERVEWVREGAGERFADIELQCLTFVVAIGEPAAEALPRLAMLFGGMDPAEAAEIPLALVGTVDEIVETLQTRRETLGLSYWVVHEAELESFAPVVARLTGT